MNDMMSEAALELPAVPDLPEGAPRLAVLLHQGLAAVLDAFGDGAGGGRDAREALAVADRLVAWCHAAAEALAGLPRVPPATKVLDGKVYWLEEDGTLVPETLVKAQRLLEDELVRGIAAGALTASALLRRFRTRSFGDAAAFQATLVQDYGAGGPAPADSAADADARGKGGNVSYFSFDRTWRVTVARADRLTFGPEIQVARELLVDFVREQPGADALKALINTALGLDREGYIRANEVLRLRGYPIEHPKWVAAMQAITDSIRTGGTAEYLRVYRRGADGRYALVPLDLANA